MLSTFVSYVTPYPEDFSIALAVRHNGVVDNKFNADVIRTNELHNVASNNAIQDTGIPTLPRSSKANVGRSPDGLNFIGIERGDWENVFKLVV